MSDRTPELPTPLLSTGKLVNKTTVKSCQYQGHNCFEFGNRMLGGILISSLPYLNCLKKTIGHITTQDRGWAVCSGCRVCSKCTACRAVCSPVTGYSHV